MKNKVGSVVKIREFAFTNKAGGTGMSNWKYDPQITGEFEVKIIKKWSDYEIGYRFIGEAVSPELIAYMAANAHETDKRVFFGEFDLAGNVL